MKFVLITIITLAFSTISAQESLLLGELKIDEIQTDIRNDQVEKVMIYGAKYSKSGVYKDSTLKGFEDYSEEGELLNRTTFAGKKDAVKYSKKYKYDEENRVISYDYIISGNGEIIGQTADFIYVDRYLVRQVTSLANIAYNYHSDGRIKSKAYYYNNKGEIDSKPWTIWFMYDEDKNLVNADADSTSKLQTMFYNDEGQLIKNDYYPGVAYSSFEYDERGNCTRQVDYEMGKKDWDSTVFIFTYDTENRLIRSASQNKKGKILIEKDWKYNSSGQLEYELFYRKNKAKYIYKYNYIYF